MIHTTPAAQLRRTGRFLAGLAAVPIAVASITGCSPIPSTPEPVVISGEAGPAGLPTTTAQPGSGPSSRSGSDSTGSDSGSGGERKSSAGTAQASSQRGCAGGGAAVPAGAGTAGTVDVDGDGQSDTLWLARTGSRRVLGVSTASGARFSASFTSISPLPAEARAARMGDGSVIILLDLGRSALLYAVNDCGITPTSGTEGGQYTFDLGYAGYGSGVGCPTLGDGLRLVSYLAEPKGEGQNYTVTRTTITLSLQGTHAANGSTKVLGRGLSERSARVTTAQSITCGSSGVTHEPET
jgi:hypothetical protein